MGSESVEPLAARLQHLRCSPRHAKLEGGDTIALAPEPIDRFTFGIPSHEHLRFFGDELAREAWHLALEAMEAAGWVSAIDAVGDPAALTFSTWDPVERIDWVFGQHVELTRAEVLPDTSSDHFAILVEAIPAP